MLKRAAIFVVIALTAALFGFTGILKVTAGFAQSVCLIFAGLTVLSLLFSLFEEPAQPLARSIPLRDPTRL